MKCTNCKKDIAQIPYIEHELRMHKAHCREERLRWMLIASNLIWAGIVAVMLFAR